MTGETSPLHSKALAFVLAHNPTEYQSIIKWKVGVACNR